MTPTEAKMFAAVGILRQTVTQQQSLMKTLIQFALAAPLQEPARLQLLKASKGQLTLDKARKHVMEIYRLSSAEEFPSFSIEVWLKQWLKEHDKRVSPATMRRYTNSVNAILGAMGSTRNKDMALRATDDVANVRAKTARAGTKASFCELIKIAGKHGSQKLGRIVYFVSSPLKSPSLG